MGRSSNTKVTLLIMCGGAVGGGGGDCECYFFYCWKAQGKIPARIFTKPGLNNIFKLKGFQLGIIGVAFSLPSFASHKETVGPAGEVFSLVVVKRP